MWHVDTKLDSPKSANNSKRNQERISNRDGWREDQVSEADLELSSDHVTCLSSDVERVNAALQECKYEHTIESLSTHAAIILAPALTANPSVNYCLASCATKRGAFWNTYDTQW